MKNYLLSVILIVFLVQQFQPAQSDKHKIISIIDSSLSRLIKLQSEVMDIHPCLKEFHPVAVPYHDSLFIFDYDSIESEYGFVKETAQPFPLPEGIQASFPLSVYDNKPTCIVNPNTFSNPAGYTTVMHEFIHCCQYNSAEPELKKSLEIYKEAMDKKNYSWEIMHPFPYDDSVFIENYHKFKISLDKDDIQSAKLYRNNLRSYLNKTDFEYMLWEEWKEGLARYVENNINRRLGFDINSYGKDKPYNRVSFYYSGELLISRLEKADPRLPGELKQLFIRMKDF